MSLKHAKCKSYLEAFLFVIMFTLKDLRFCIFLAVYLFFWTPSLLFFFFFNDTFIQVEFSLISTLLLKKS